MFCSSCFQRLRLSSITLLPLSMTFCSSQVLLNYIHHLLSMLDFHSSCTAHAHRICSAPAVTLQILSVFLIWLSHKWINSSWWDWAPPQWQLCALTCHFCVRFTGDPSLGAFPYLTSMALVSFGLIPQSVLASLSMCWMNIDCWLSSLYGCAWGIFHRN